MTKLKAASNRGASLTVSGGAVGHSSATKTRVSQSAPSWLQPDVATELAIAMVRTADDIRTRVEKDALVRIWGPLECDSTRTMSHGAVEWTRRKARDPQWISGDQRLMANP